MLSRPSDVVKLFLYVCFFHCLKRKTLEFYFQGPCRLNLILDLLGPLTIAILN
jgi:hypothetical protein